VWFFGNASTEPIRAAMRRGDLGQMCTPAEGRSPLDGVVWAADNGCYTTRGFPGTDRWLAWLARHTPHVERCLFATAPDVVGDAASTLARSLPVLPRIRALGYPAALVGQDGLHQLAVPWDSFDVLFLGGSTGWKLGPHAAALTRTAHQRGKSVHMGRVNSRRRYTYAQSLGCASVDGTLLTIAPDINLTRVRSWRQPTHPPVHPPQPRPRHRPGVRSRTCQKAGRR
jgi:hypothetical protein